MIQEKAKTLMELVGKGERCVRQARYPAKSGKIKVKHSDQVMVFEKSCPLIRVEDKGGRCVRPRTLPCCSREI
jgi:membrane-bound ClpP family serine protease